MGRARRGTVPLTCDGYEVANFPWKQHAVDHPLTNDVLYATIQRNEQTFVSIWQKKENP